jgi:hypothetical protein
MKKKRDTVRYTAKQIKGKIARGEDRTDWGKANAMTGKKLEASIRADVDDVHREPDWTQPIKDLPFRQSDPVWGKDLMWDRTKVMEVHRQYNGASRKEAEELLRKFPGDNTIANEGCLLTSLAMVLRLLAPRGRYWTPRTLNKFAFENLYYTRAGLSMVTLYADMVSDASKGEVQLLLKEEYLSGELGWPRTQASKCLPLRAYRMLSEAERKNVVIILKIGTYDDTVASHFVVADPANPGSVDEDDVPILDPAQPMKPVKRVWRLSDSSRQIRRDNEIAEEWRQHKIGDLQLAGVWVFARWESADQTLLGDRFIVKLGSLAQSSAI